VKLNYISKITKSLLTLSQALLLITFFLIFLTIPSCNSQDSLSKSINLSANYIDTFSKPNGMFDYEVDIVTGNVSNRDYNILRHAGTMYALANSYLVNKNKKSLDTLENSTKFLKTCCIKPVDNNKDILGIWSLKSINKSLRTDKLKLGGTGLGLVALLSMEKIRPGLTDKDTLRKLGNFILFMQKEEGNFYSRYIPPAGKDDSWTSLYYPGEAALGLVMLYEYDPQPKWFNHAVKVLTYLAKSRKNVQKVPPDHWALLATAKIIEISKKQNLEIPNDLLINHGKQVVNGIVAGVPAYSKDDPNSGCLTRDCRTTPSSTRLEGLISFYKVLGPQDTELKEKIATISHNGIEFLIRTQIKDGPYKGAIPSVYIDDITLLKKSSRRQIVVRIDYVQHALSAFLDYKKVFESKKGN